MNRLKEIYTKIVRAGDPRRPSRFHTLTGMPAPTAAFADLPRCVGQTLAFKFSGRRPVLPWIPFPALRYLAARTTRDWRVLEIGSGMSTIWLAERCGYVDSIEADERWVGLVESQIARRNLRNVQVHYRWRADEMCCFSNWPDESLDLVFVDGGPRPECFTAALPKLKPGGFVYVDNTDVAAISQHASELVHAAARERGWRMLVFRGLVPCNLFVNEGLLLQKTPSSA